MKNYFIFGVSTVLISSASFANEENTVTEQHLQENYTDCVTYNSLVDELINNGVISNSTAFKSCNNPRHGQIDIIDQVPTDKGTFNKYSSQADYDRLENLCRTSLGDGWEMLNVVDAFQLPNNGGLSQQPYKTWINVPTKQGIENRLKDSSLAQKGWRFTMKDGDGGYSEPSYLREQLYINQSGWSSAVACQHRIQGQGQEPEQIDPEQIDPDQIVFDRLGEDVCRSGYRPLDRYEAEEQKSALVARMGRWQITGLKGNWVIMGSGYKGEIKQESNESTFCYPNND